MAVSSLFLTIHRLLQNERLRAAPGAFLVRGLGALSAPGMSIVVAATMPVAESAGSF